MVDQNIIDYLTKLYVTPEGAQVYAYLLNREAQTAQAIARNTHIPKTTVYRRLEELKVLGLANEQLEENRKLFTTAPVSLLNLLLVKKEQELAELRAQLPVITQLLHNQSESYDPETKVLFYRGRDGIQQMLWNVLRAKTELLGYTYRDLTPLIGQRFYDTWRENFLRRGLRARDIFSDEYIRSKFGSAEPQSVGWAEWRSRYLPAQLLDIQHQMDIYNNVVGIYNWVGSDVFGVEIYNEKVAQLQRQIFEILWKQGRVCDYAEQYDIFKRLAKT